MREISFRGKDSDGVWHEGYYCQLNGKSHRIYTGYAEMDCGSYYPNFYTAVPETIGQYTGLIDKNGTKIFEGDIATFDAYDQHYVGVITIIEGNACILCGESAAPFLDHAIEKYGATVVGNIHDNSELLKGSAKK